MPASPTPVPLPSPIDVSYPETTPSPVSPETPTVEESTPTTTGPALQTVNAGAREGGSLLAAVVAAGIAVLV